MLGRNRLQCHCSQCCCSPGGRDSEQGASPHHITVLQLRKPQPGDKHLIRWKCPAWDVAGCHGTPVVGPLHRAVQLPDSVLWKE